VLRPKDGNELWCAHLSSEIIGVKVLTYAVSPCWYTSYHDTLAAPFNATGSEKELLREADVEVKPCQELWWSLANFSHSPAKAGFQLARWEPTMNPGSKVLLAN
jgi:hypothetical protein